MNGAAHYDAAEQLLEQAGQAQDDQHAALADRCIAEAAVHATLALAAVTALPHVGEVTGIHDDCHLWADATAPGGRPAGPIAALPYAAVPR